MILHNEVGAYAYITVCQIPVCVSGVHDSLLYWPATLDTPICSCLVGPGTASWVRSPAWQAACIHSVHTAEADTETG
jgi:hypothetical protein